MPMDPQLAAIYGTNQDEGDVEKLAAAELAEKLAADEDVDTEGLSEEEAEALAQQVLAAEEGGGEETEQGDEDEEQTEQKAKGKDEDEEESSEESEEEGQEKTSEAQEKLAEADYLGRVMAHAYTQELRKIAAAQEEETKEEPEKKTKKAAAGKVSNFLKKGASKKMKFKKSAPEMSALDTLAARRAEELIAEVQKAEQTEKTSASDQQAEALKNAVEQRAYEMLEQAGYIQKEEK